VPGVRSTSNASSSSAEHHGPRDGPGRVAEHPSLTDMLDHEDTLATSNEPDTTHDDALPGAPHFNAKSPYIAW
jgi:hypothetical protein